MLTLLLGLVVTLSLALVVGGFVGGAVMARQRKEAETAAAKAKRLAEELAQASKATDRHKAEAADATKRAHELARDNKHYGEVNRGLADELAGAQGQVGHLTETNVGLHEALKARDELIGGMCEALDESRTLLARLCGLAEQAKALIHSRRGT